MADSVLLLWFDEDRTSPAIEDWLAHFDSTGSTAATYQLNGSTVIAAEGPAVTLPLPEQLRQPQHSVRAKGGSRLGRRELVPHRTVVRIGSASVGDGSIAVFAGPCAVENPEQMFATARFVANTGAVGLRGGAFKPRTTPYAFQGLQWAGLELLAEARTVTGLPIVTEVVEPGHVERVAGVADALQIGARNMQNFSLLTEAGRAGIPVVLKRGLGVTVDELLSAAEYLLVEGNSQVILCERGIRTFEPSTRFTLDLSAVAYLKTKTHLPVMVDPSHSTGIPELVEPMTLAAAAAGADALLIDVHVQPEQALCDGKQALLPGEFARLMQRLDTVAMGLGRRLGGHGGEPDGVPNGVVQGLTGGWV